MYGFREGISLRTHGASQGGSLGGKFSVLSMVVIIAGGTAGCAGGHTGLEPPATASLSPLPDFESGYVGLVETPLEEAPAIADSGALMAPSEQPIAAAYARRYGISSELALDITEHAIDAGVDPELAFRLVRVESVFKVSARGRQGALGLTQLMPGTARSLDRSLDTEREILDPDNNLRVGFRYLREMIERYDNVRLALLAYNRGETAVDRALRRGIDPENGYSHKVLGTRGSKPYTGTGLLSSPVE